MCQKQNHSYFLSRKSWLDSFRIPTSITPTSPIFFKKRYLGRKCSYYKNKATNNSTCHSSYWAKILIPGFSGGFWSGCWMLLGKATSSSEVLAVSGQSHCPSKSYSKWQSYGYSLPKHYICIDCQYGKRWLGLYFY